MSLNRDQSPSAGSTTSSELNYSGSRNSSFENSRNLKDKWPERISKRTRVALAPPKEIENIPEVSSPSWSCDAPASKNGVKELDNGDPHKDEIDGSAPVYRSTTIRNGDFPETDSDTAPLTSTSNSRKRHVVARGLDSTRNWICMRTNAIRDIKFTKRQWLVMVVLSVVTLTSSFAVCLFPPYFPGIAQSKGASAEVYGPIIGTNCLVAFLVTPTIGKNLEKIGVKFSFVMGAFAGGCCCILSGFLEFFPPGYKFILEAVLIRAVHACSNAFVITSSFAFIVVEFPDNVAKLFALTRAMMNLAQMLGPIVGGALYDIGGFSLPFLVLGSVQIVVSLSCIWILPKYRKKREQANGSTNRDDERTLDLIDVMRIPGMWISFATFVFSTMSNGFLSITLEPLVLRKFGISYLHVGFLFGLKDGANSFASPIWGYLCDRFKSHLRLLILISTFLATFSFVLIGPFPGLPFKASYDVVVVALIINGFGIGGQQVAGVVHAMKMAAEGNLPDDASTHGFIAGLWSSLSGAGRFISRSGSGLLVDHIGFQLTTVIIDALQALVFVITSSFMIAKKISGKERSRADGVRTPTRNSPNEHGPKCGIGRCFCNVGDKLTTIVGINTPSEAVSSKAVTIPIPNLRGEDLENSLPYGSIRSHSISPTFVHAQVSTSVTSEENSQDGEDSEEKKAPKDDNEISPIEENKVIEDKLNNVGTTQQILGEKEKSDELETGSSESNINHINEYADDECNPL